LTVDATLEEGTSVHGVTTGDEERSMTPRLRGERAVATTAIPAGPVSGAAVLASGALRP
jgi:hypothetical protein